MDLSTIKSEKIATKTFTKTSAKRTIHRRRNHRCCVIVFAVCIIIKTITSFCCFTHAWTLIPHSLHQNPLASSSSTTILSMTSSSLQLRSAQHRRPVDGNNDNDDTNLRKNLLSQDEIRQQQKEATSSPGQQRLLSGVLSPYDILYADVFSNSKVKSKKEERSLPLHGALRVLKETLRAIAMGETPLSDSTVASKQTVVRIEHSVSQTVDPLCWLQAQAKKTTTTTNLDGSSPPIIYFATGEGSLETAVYGSAATYKGTVDDPKYWTLVDTLPDSTYLYGGQRFDVHNESAEGQEWKPFSKGLWVLPAIELRREELQQLPTQKPSSQNNDNHQQHDSFQFSSTSTKNSRTTIAVHLYKQDNAANDGNGFAVAARNVLRILEAGMITDATVPAVPPTTLPPVLSRESTYGPNLDGQEIYERGVNNALKAFEAKGSAVEEIETVGTVNKTSHSTETSTENVEHHGLNIPQLKKVVLARRMDLKFGEYATSFSALDILRKWKFASRPGGHLFYIHPGGGDYATAGGPSSSEFFGCTPERLFQIQNSHVLSEALAGTRPRGSTQEADEELCRELFASPKDQAENQITGDFIRDAFEEMRDRGWIKAGNKTVTTMGNTLEIDDKNSINSEHSSSNDDTIGGRFYVRRLRHLQHICQQFQGDLISPGRVIDVTRYLFAALHPTPAMGGYPKKEAMEFIREHESVGFDRGFYSGPVGFIGKNKADIAVGIRSGLVSRSGTKTKVSVYAGAGIVPGSTVQAEWAETNYKLGVVSSIFPQSPITLQSYQSPNAAWATAFIEELIRNGVTRFYICPGSRSTPLVAAVAKAVRSNVGVVQALSIHDERGAGFRAVGYGRGAGRPAAVITSSGTAIANLYPAIVEAGMDGVPMLLLTADRPYESRDTGANQAIDQVKAFSSTYVRWFRDVLPPNDDVPVSVALADAAHAVSVTRKLRGPVHLNIQFRENLAPDSGPIRNDDRIGSITKYDGVRFTDVPGFQRWSTGGGRWMQMYSAMSGDWESFPYAIAEVANLITQSRRGIIVVGNLRSPTDESQVEEMSQTASILSSFAQSIGFPIVAGAQSGNLRFDCPAVVPFAEHVLRYPDVRKNLKPDLVLQFGAPLVSTEIPSVIKSSMSEGRVHHVIVHPHHPHERADPEFTVSHRVSADISPFIKALSKQLDGTRGQFSSDLAPLVLLGRKLQAEMPAIISDSAREVSSQHGDYQAMTEPEVVLSMSQVLCDKETPELSLFLSNSMPVRDAEAFLYPMEKDELKNRSKLFDIGVNRGASGIDGIIASATGFADATDRPTTLLIGDVAALHDINSLHALRNGLTSQEAQAQKTHPLTTIVLNNDGGGIFSFLPIAQHGNDVSFDEFFGTPTSSFSFEKGVESFGIPFEHVKNPRKFREAYMGSIESKEASVIEVEVAPRSVNVAVHREITKRAISHLDTLLAVPPSTTTEQLPLKHYTQESLKNDEQEVDSKSKTLVLLHGWMGDKSEWDEVGTKLVESLSSDWSVVSIDLPGHGESPIRHSTDIQAIKNMLRIADGAGEDPEESLTVESMALSVLESLKEHHGVKGVDALAGYSLGGRVALAMKRICTSNSHPKLSSLMNDGTMMALLSAYPGEVLSPEKSAGQFMDEESKTRIEKDDQLANKITALSNKALLASSSSVEDVVLFSGFLKRWYSAPLWGSLNQKLPVYSKMMEKRVEQMTKRGPDLAMALRQCSPPRCHKSDWKFVVPENTLFVAGGLDSKYSNLGKEFSNNVKGVKFVEVPQVGHAVLVEAASAVSDALTCFLSSQPQEIECLDSNADEEKSFVAKSTQSQDREVMSTTKSLSNPTVEGIPPVESRSELDGVGKPKFTEKVNSLDFEVFAVTLVDEQRKQSGVFGLGWGDDARARESNRLSQRSGFIIQVLSADGENVGVGEVSPLHGLHNESFEDSENQLEAISKALDDLDTQMIPNFDARSILSLDGALGRYLDDLEIALDTGKLFPSVRSGLEMAIISLASQVVRLPIHQALSEYSPEVQQKSVAFNAMLPLNGLITRGSTSMQSSISSSRDDGGVTKFPSLKVKVGHQDSQQDAFAISQAFKTISDASYPGRGNGGIRADANRAWNIASAVNFAAALEEFDIHAVERLEYVEEPLERQTSIDGTNDKWLFSNQVDALEQLYQQTAIPYALDESISDLADLHNHDFESMFRDIKDAFPRFRGCAALILKPSLLGLELSLQLARAVRQELGIGAVFTSSFDSGVGLSYISFIGSASDAYNGKTDGTESYPHGLGTFTMLGEDTLSPSFGSYVNDHGLLNVASLSRAFYGLSLDEIRDLSISPIPTYPTLSSATEDVPTTKRTITKNDNNETSTSSIRTDGFEASTSTSNGGREISVVAALPLPFSADIACARFTDLPQQPRWSPWITSVAYLDAGSETEWTLRVRGVDFKWRATSSLLEAPYKGIRWESVMGLKNIGVVEFVSTGETSSLMKVRMTIITPRILSSLFKRTPAFFEDFLQNKLLKWSLEMFRDVVKGDLALEGGDVELGDALFGAVEGKASAIEATLSLPMDTSGGRNRNSRK